MNYQDDDILQQVSAISEGIDDILSDDYLSKLIIKDNNKTSTNKNDSNRKSKPIMIFNNDNKEDLYSSESCSFSPASLTKYNHWFHDSNSNYNLFDDDTNIDDDDNNKIMITPIKTVNNDDNSNTIKRGNHNTNHNHIHNTNTNTNSNTNTLGSFTATKSTLKEKIKLKYEDIIYDNTITINNTSNDIFINNSNDNNGLYGEQNEHDLLKLLLGDNNGLQKLHHDASSSLSEMVLVSSNYTSTQRNSNMEINLLKQISITSTEQLDKILDKESDLGNYNHNDNNNNRDNLFAESSSNKIRSSSSSITLPANVTIDNDDISYESFLNHLGSPQCADIATMMRKFLNSVLGPYGDGITPPSHDADYIFYGTKKLEERCIQYFDDMEHYIEKHVTFKDASHEKVLSIRDCMERYIFNRIADIAFKSIEVPEDDEKLVKKMKILSFLTPDVLDIKPELRNDMIWGLARDELKKLNSYRTPGEKINRIVKSAEVIMRYLSLEAAKKDRNDNVGADDFLPLFIFVVLHCHIPKLASNCSYIQAFYNPGRLRSKQGYYFVNLQSAIEFVLNVEADMISIDPVVFASKCAENEKLLEGDDICEVVDNISTS